MAGDGLAGADTQKVLWVWRRQSAHTHCRSSGGQNARARPFRAWSCEPATGDRPAHRSAGAWSVRKPAHRPATKGGEPGDRRYPGLSARDG